RHDDRLVTESAARPGKLLPPRGSLIRVKAVLLPCMIFVGCCGATMHWQLFGNPLGGLFMRIRHIAIFSAAVLAGALAGNLVGPHPAEAVAREPIEPHRNATSPVAPPDSSAVPSGAPSADTLYSNGLRDITSGKYDLARSEFQDYLKYYGDTDLASNAQFYLGEIAYSQKNYDLAVAEYEKVL